MFPIVIFAAIAFVPITLLIALIEERPATLKILVGIWVCLSIFMSIGTYEFRQNHPDLAQMIRR